jgi:transposase
MKPASEVIEVNLDEWEALLERARQEPLDEEGYQKLQAALRAFRVLTEMIGEKDTTISRLRALLAKPSTEKTSKVLERAGLEPPPKRSPPLPASAKPKSGHGRNGAAAYRSAERIKIAHALLKAGDHCLECLKGKVYARKEPGLRIRVVGQAPLAASVYELEFLRCNLCGGVFEADVPEGIGEEKYDASAAAMIALLKYGSGVPFYRLAGLGGVWGFRCRPRRSGRSWRRRRNGSGRLSKN